MIMAFPTQEPEFETVTVKTWNLEQKILGAQNEPYNSTYYASMMNSSRWFLLNISSSDTVKVEISIVKHDGAPVKQRVAGPFIGTKFTQKAEPTVTATYYVDIYNENPTQVTLHGNVLVEQRNTYYHTVNLYVLPGFLVMLGGVVTLLFGAYKKPRKPSKSRRKHREISKN